MNPIRIDLLTRKKTILLAEITLLKKILKEFDDKKRSL